MALALDYSNYASEFLDLLGVSPNLADTLTLRSNAVAVFTDVTSNKPAGLRYPPTGSDSPGRLVFLPFPFDAVSATATAPPTFGSWVIALNGLAR